MSLSEARFHDLVDATQQALEDLFDESGLVTYDLWFKFMTFRFVSPTLMPGLVRLPHTWS